ncbi:hypothetical protein P153DRAFT_189231 [Dothidotthia symphoricarpi CBS 119687]|uniref:Uncharacterized protein n=1 Tax=Dothidotthia symphoricarpi CBS 119687 TaxID=1392245 RepID=A0A6A6APA8_9PLEO|nr:uncharacterized protein P153DRAFT_189231 [Dothidotthia symphoricarpi CBS 119687]KAF2132341.1 hypothetical protein P153DRAFT_189231 [Dothidotthia symphoricarpi CBS 119687]
MVSMGALMLEFLRLLASAPFRCRRVVWLSCAIQHERLVVDEKAGDALRRLSRDNEAVPQTQRTRMSKQTRDVGTNRVRSEDMEVAALRTTQANDSAWTYAWDELLRRWMVYPTHHAAISRMNKSFQSTPAARWSSRRNVRCEAVRIRTQPQEL